MSSNLIVSAVLLIILSILSGLNAQTHIGGQFVVKLAADQISRADEIARAYGLVNSGSVGEMGDTFLFKRPESVAPQSVNADAKAARHELRQWKRMDVQALDSLQNNPGISWVEQDAYSAHTPDAIPSDPQFPRAWHLRNTAYANNDINVLPVWNAGNTGQGVVVSVLDLGVFVSNADISPNWLPQYSYNFATRSNNPTPSDNTQLHGTFVSGLIVGKDSNNFCSVGVAYGAKLAAVRFLGVSGVTGSDIATWLTKFPADVHISSNSWGYTACTQAGCNLMPEQRVILDALESGARSGRNGKGRVFVFSAGNDGSYGKGRVFVFSAGNDGSYGGDVNMNQLKTTRFPINVSALDKNGKLSWYSATGTPVFVTAPGGGSIEGMHSINSNGCDTGSGTSYAAPVVSGVVALLLKQNPNLTWRDVKYVLARSAYKNDPTDSDWARNGANYNINHKYGFGRVDAGAAVTLASSWRNVGPEVALPSRTVTVNQAIPDASGISSVVTINDSLCVEHVQVLLNIAHPRRGQLAVTLTSPSGTVSRLARARTDNNANYSNWTFLTMRNWGETAKGSWRLTVQDTVAGTQGSLVSWTLNVFGAQGC